VTGLAIALAVAAGLAGAVQAAVMGELGGRAGVFPALAFSGVVAVVIGLARPLRLVRLRSDRDHVDARSRTGPTRCRRVTFALQEQLTLPAMPTPPDGKVSDTVTGM
jgi:hypothetical protein